MKYAKRNYSVLKVSLLHRATSLFLMPLLLMNTPPVLAEVQSDVDSTQSQTTYPAPVLTPKHVKANKKLPDFTPTSSTLSFSDHPTDQEIFSHTPFEEPLVPIGGKTSPEENAELAHLLLDFSKRTVRDDYAGLEAFLTNHPKSPWRISLLTDLGWSYRQTGWYSKSMSAWEEAWSLGKTETSPRAKAVVDRALSELVVLNARLGRIERLGPLFTEIQDRKITGSAREKIQAAKQGYSLMTSHPEQGYRCGPMAVETLRQHWEKPIPFSLLVKTEPSTVKGTSLTQISRLAQKLSMDLIMAKRAPGSQILVPSVINWKVGHFAAIIGQQRGLIHLHDPTFGDDVWISPKALDAEASGYFLIKNQPLPTGWSPVSAAEGSTVWGKGPTSVSDPKANRCPSPSTASSSPCGGMAVYSIFEMLASLSVDDTPLFYRPAYGPGVNFHIDYSQCETYQPSVFTYSNLGPLWTFNWLSYITDDPTNVGADVSQYEPGGGTLAFTGYDSATQTYAAQALTGAVLKITSSTSYELDEPDGSKEIFAVANTASPRKVFMTQSIDPNGFALTYSYDSYYRMVAVTDATGLVTTIAYGSTDSTNPAFYQIATVTDPFGRTATLAYTSGNLTSSTDMIGLVSSYGYSSGVLSSLTTPYGTTTFNVGQDSDKRWVQVTDPQGGQERLETWNNYNGNVITPSVVPSGVDNTYLQYRNSFYWNKKAMLVCGGTLDYTQAQITHWLHEPDISTMSGQVESTKAPLESRVYYNYAGQSLPQITGNNNFPTRITRILSDGSTQETDMTYNSLGNMTQKKDPLGRITNYNYDTNGIDLLSVTQQKSGSATDTLASATYNSNHQPLTVTDASGQTTTYVYYTSGVTNGLIHTVTNAKGETTTYGYDSNGRLTSVTGPVTGSTVSMSYDGFGRLGTYTNINGYETSYDYDNLNRVTQITYPDSTTDQNVYTNLDRTLSKDRQGHWTHYFYNPVRQLVGTLDSQGRTTSYERCLCGELKGIVDGLGHRTAWTQDVEGRILTKTFADGSQYTYTYDTGYTSRLLTVTDPLGQVATYSYNEDDTLSGVAYTSGGSTTTPNVNVGYTYDPYYPRLTQMTDGTGTTYYTYNSVWSSGSPITGGGRLETETGPLGSTAAITYTYDQLGRVTGTSINGVSSSVTLDSLGRITGASNPLGNFTYGYYGVTPRLESVSNDQNGLNTSYSYQTGSTQDYRLADITNNITGTTVLSKFDYTYNADGTIATWQEQADSNTPTLWTYGYDRADQLTSAVQTNTSTSAVLAQDYYGYDVAGNRLTEQVGLGVTATSFNSVNQITSTSAGGPLRFTGTLNKPGTVTVGGNPATVDASNNFSGLTTVGTGTNTVAVVATNLNGNAATNNYQVVVPSNSAVSPTYDNDGNMTNNGHGQTYTWDAKNELASITYTGGASTLFSYDGLSRRTKIVEKNASGTVTSTKQYIWIGSNIAEERDSSGTTVTRRFFAQGEQVPGATSPADKLYYTRDHLGSIRELVDHSGSLVSRLKYDPWGRVTVVSGTNLPTIQYAGYYDHATSGLNLTLFRAYDPNAAKWLSRDPMGERGGIDLYGFVDNSPMNRIDPLGLVWYNPGTWNWNEISGSVDTKLGLGLGLEDKLNLFGAKIKAGAEAGAGALGNWGLCPATHRSGVYTDADIGATASIGGKKFGVGANFDTETWVNSQNQIVESSTDSGTTFGSGSTQYSNSDFTSISEEADLALIKFGFSINFGCIFDGIINSK